jgi:hypothetical protein
MSYLLVGALALALLYWGGKPGRFIKLANWRTAAGLLSIGVFAAAAFVGVRGGWGKAILLALIGVWLAYSARWPRAAVKPAPSGGPMSEAEARATLGVASGATVPEIQAAYARLIQVAHPDRGGTDGLAAQLNAARDRLLKG